LADIFARYYTREHRATPGVDAGVSPAKVTPFAGPPSKRALAAFDHSISR
jgi:hypothetical protein